MKQVKQLYAVQLFVSKTTLGRETVKTSDGYEVFESDDQMRGGYYVPSTYENVRIVRYDMVANIKACNMDEYDKMVETAYEKLSEETYKLSPKKKEAWCRNYAHDVVWQKTMPIVKEDTIEDIASKVKLPKDAYDFYSDSRYFGTRFYRLGDDDFYYRTKGDKYGNSYNKFSEDCEDWDEVDNLVTDLLDKIPLK